MISRASPPWRRRPDPPARPRQAAQSRNSGSRRAARRQDRHRPYPLGDPWPAEREQRPPACHRTAGGRAQRHHREFPRAARRAGKPRAPIRHRDRYRSGRPSGHRGDGRGASPVEAVAAALPRLRGAFALAFLFEGENDLLIGARKGSPLAVGYGEGEMFSAPTRSRSRRSPTRSAIWRTATRRSSPATGPRSTTRKARS